MQYFWRNKSSPIKVFPNSKLLLLCTVNIFDSQILLVILIGFSDIQQKINLNKVNTSYKVVAFWFFRSVFSRSRTEYSVFLRVQSKCGKILIRKTPSTDSFQAVEIKWMTCIFYQTWYFVHSVYSVYGGTYCISVIKNTLINNVFLLFYQLH